MGPYFNKVILVGRLTRDPEEKYSSVTGSMFVTFSIAVNRPAGQGEERTDFFRIIAVGKTAEFIRNYAKKGKLVLVEGELRQRKWTNKEGINRETYEIFCTNFQFLLPKSFETEQTEVEYPYDEKSSLEVIDDNYYEKSDEKVEESKEFSSDIDEIWADNNISGFEDISEDEDEPPF